jgi:hypothetical protein
MVKATKKGVEMATLQERLEELQNQQKQMEANFHQITGAITVIQQMITDEEGTKTEVKEDKKEKK